MASLSATQTHVSNVINIQTGLDDLTKLVQKWTADPSSYSPPEMRECLDSWRDVLFKHLDEEVCPHTRQIQCVRVNALSLFAG